MRIFTSRLVAFALDCLVLFAIFAAPRYAIMVISGTWFLDEDSSNVLTWAWVGISVTLPSYGYFVVCDHSQDGMTLGKRVMNLAVRADDGSRLTWTQSLVRNLVKLIPWEATHIMIFFPEPFSQEDPNAGKIVLMVIANVLLLVWLVAPLLDRPRFRGVHDLVVGSRVEPSGDHIHRPWEGLVAR